MDQPFRPLDSKDVNYHRKEKIERTAVLLVNMQEIQTENRFYFLKNIGNGRVFSMNMSHDDVLTSCL